MQSESGIFNHGAHYICWNLRLNCICLTRIGSCPVSLVNLYLVQHMSSVLTHWYNINWYVWWTGGYFWEVNVTWTDLDWFILIQYVLNHSLERFRQICKFSNTVIGSMKTTMISISTINVTSLCSVPLACKLQTRDMKDPATRKHLVGTKYEMTMLRFCPCPCHMLCV